MPTLAFITRGVYNGDMKNKLKQLTEKLHITEKRAITLLCVALGLVFLALGGYVAYWYAERARIQGDAERYQALYTVEFQPIATQIPLPSPTVAPTDTPEPRIYALPTAPYTLFCFDDLLLLNPETVGFLDIEDIARLPVVQRENDNDYYLSHNFDGKEAREGTLFMDGLNRLVPEDDCLIVYGHNMHNGTMFGKLSAYKSADFLKTHPVVRFDTIYEKRLYVPFAAFTTSVDPKDPEYFDVRQFVFDEQGFELFVLKLQSRSAYAVPVDVRYGDRLLLLVTCSSANNEGRFILALRGLREGETEEEMAALVSK